MSRPKNKEETILSAALNVFIEKGFSNSSIKDIADTAGVGKGTIYEYFNNKNELFIETINFEINQRCQQARNVIDSKTTFMDKFNAFIDLAHEAAEDDSKHVEFLIINTSMGLKPEYKVEFQNLLRKMKGDMEAIISQILIQGKTEGKIGEIDLEFASRIIDGFIMGYIRDVYRKEWSNEQKQKEKTDLINLIMHGICISREQFS
ncbi:MAG: TetR/AcrR family transcriptional regulator [Eubacteriales bacterium]|jgi:AcrR family transcriptional regulator